MLTLSRYSYCIHHPHRSQTVSLLYDASSKTPKRYLTADVKMSNSCNRNAIVALLHNHIPPDALWEGTSNEYLPLGVAEVMAGAAGLDLIVIETCFCDVSTRELGYRLSHFQPTLDPIMIPILKRMLRVS